MAAISCEEAGEILGLAKIKDGKKFGSAVKHVFTCERAGCQLLAKQLVDRLSASWTVGIH
jgi:hypothetical protein